MVKQRKRKILQHQVCYSFGTLRCCVWGLEWWRGGGSGRSGWRGGGHMLLLLCGCLSGERHVLSESEGPFPAVGLQRHTHMHMYAHAQVHEHHENKNRMPSIMCSCTKCRRQISFLFFSLLLWLLDIKQKPPPCTSLVELMKQCMQSF